MKKWTVAVAIALLAVVAWERVPTAGMGRQYARAFVVSARGPSEKCGYDYCTLKPLVRNFSFTELGTVYDIVISVTLAYRTTNKEDAAIRVVLTPDGGKPRTLRPGALALASSKVRATTTARWVVTRLKPGRIYAIDLILQGLSGIGVHIVRSTNVVLTIEAVPSAEASSAAAAS